MDLIFFVPMVIGLSLASIGRARWLVVNMALIGVVAFFEGFVLPTVVLAISGPFWANALFIGVLFVLYSRGHLDEQLWIADLEDDEEFLSHAEELQSWELNECKEMSESKEEYREMVITWSEQNR